MVPPAIAAELQDRDVAVILVLLWAHGGIDMPGIAAGIGADSGGIDPGQRVIPFARVIAASLPVMGNHDEPVAQRIAELVEPAVAL